MTNTNKTDGKTSKKIIKFAQCYYCGNDMSEGKRWYHGDQDDLVCIRCADYLDQHETCYAGQKVANMPIEEVK